PARDAVGHWRVAVRRRTHWLLLDGMASPPKPRQIGDLPAMVQRCGKQGAGELNCGHRALWALHCLKRDPGERGVNAAGNPPPNWLGPGGGAETLANWIRASPEARL